MADKFVHRDKIEGYKPHRALQRDFSLIAKPYLTERGIPFDTTKYQNGGIFKAGDNDFWFDSDEQGFFTNHPDFKDTPYNEIKDLLEAVLGSTDSDESDIDEYTCDEFANGDKDLADYLRTVLGTGKHSTEDFESALEGYEEEPESTNLGTIAKSIVSQDLGRSF